MSDNRTPSSGCCNFCFKLILTSGLAALFIWLSLRTTKPKCSIKSFYLPALNTSATRSNHTLYYTINLKNKMKDKGVRYDDVSLRFFYGANSTSAIANSTLKGFYQGHGKDADKSGQVETYSLPLDSALQAVSNGSKAVFRMELRTRVRYRIALWNTKRRDFVVQNTTVEVDSSGKNSATLLHRASVFPLILIVLIMLV